MAFSLKARLLWLGLPFLADVQGFQHPGMLHRQADLQRMRDSVEAKKWSHK